MKQGLILFISSLSRAAFLPVIAVILPILTELVACGQANENISVKGTIIAYVKCPGSVVIGQESFNENMIFGLYIVSKEKDLLAFNVPHPKVESLLDAKIDMLNGGDPVRMTNSVPVIFSYKRATDNEIIIIPACVHSLMFPPDVLSNSIQIIIDDIKKETEK